MTLLRIGVIGLGWRAGFTKYFHQPAGRSVVAAGADPDPSRFPKFRERVNPDAQVTTSVR
jgi:predicted dehydrogenase